MQLDSTSLFKWNCWRRNILATYKKGEGPYFKVFFSTAVRRATPEVQSATPPRFAHRVPTSHAGEADGLYNAPGPF